MALTLDNPKPPTCEDCGQEIDSEAILWEGPCPAQPLWGHTLDYEGICQMARYLEE